IFPTVGLILSFGCGVQDGVGQETNTLESENLAGAIDLNPSKDAYVRSGPYADTNYGTAVDLTLKGGRSTSIYARNDWLTFNLKGYSNITSAKLRLYVKRVGTENTNTVPAKLSFASGSGSDSWSETAITWNNVPPGGSQIGSVGIT